VHPERRRGIHLFSSMGGDDEEQMKPDEGVFRVLKVMPMAPGGGLQWHEFCLEGAGVRRRRLGWLLVCGVAGIVLSPVVSRAQFSDPGSAPPTSAMSIPQDRLIQPEALVRALKVGNARPVVLQVGSHVMFSQAHISSAQYAGPGSQAQGLKLLETKVASLKKNAPVVIYCGCCPWNRCPNVGPAFHRLLELGFKNVKVLYLPSNFGDDWVGKGYSVETGG